jgi:hypothetical protein
MRVLLWAAAVGYGLFALTLLGYLIERMEQKGMKGGGLLISAVLVAALFPLTMPLGWGMNIAERRFKRGEFS